MNLRFHVFIPLSCVVHQFPRITSLLDGGPRLKGRPSYDWYLKIWFAASNCVLLTKIRGLFALGPNATQKCHAPCAGGEESCHHKGGRDGTVA